MADPVTAKDLIGAAWNSQPTEFADYFSGVMVGRVNDKVDQIRQQAAARIMGQDVETPPVEEPVDQVDDEEEEVDASTDEADNEQDGETDEDTETDSRSE